MLAAHTRCCKPKMMSLLPVSAIQVLAWVVLAGMLGKLIRHQQRNAEPRRHISQLSTSLRELRHSRNLLRRVVVRQEKAREDQSQLLAQKMHEELGQQLVVLRSQLALLHTSLAQGRVLEPTLLLSSIEQVDQSIQVVRSVSAELHPKVLDLGVVAALEWVVAEFVSATGTPCKLQFGASDFPMHAEQIRVIFRTVQQALNRVARRADAAQVGISLDQQGTEYVLEITDDGTGFDTVLHPDQLEDQFALQERIRALDGEMRMCNTPEQGSVQGLRLPQ